MSGNVFFRYTRTVSYGATLGANKVLQTYMTDGDYDGGADTKIIRSLGGAQYPVNYNVVPTWRVDLLPVDGDDLKRLREFIESVQTGATFEFKGDGTLTFFPALYTRCLLVQQPKWKRVGKTEYWGVGFSVEKLVR